MKLVGLMPVRTEAWVLGLSLRVALMWCDEVICADHGSIDKSREIMEELADETHRVIVRDDREQEWREMEQRQMLLETARELGATHIAMIDADEILTGNPFRAVQSQNPQSDGANIGRACMRGIIGGMPENSVLQLPGYNLRGSLTRYHSNGIWGNRWFSLVFKDSPELNWGGDRFHAREPRGKRLEPYRPIAQAKGGVMHLWGCSERRLRAKHALYKVTERLRWPAKPIAEINQEYNLWRTPHDSYVAYPRQQEWLKEWTFADVPESWWASYAHLMKYLDIDAEPWQEQECRRLVAEHGAETFQGLDLFGVA